MIATKTSKVVKPRALKKGDKVGVFCPSSRPETPAVVARAQRLIEEMGFIPVPGRNVLSSHGFSAGSDEQRCEDLQAFYADQYIKGVFCLAGGYGALRMLAHLDY